jgi:hypothetical protein
MQRCHDRIKETGTATAASLGSVVTLSGAASGFGSFSTRFTIGEPIYFVCVDGTTWGTYRGYLRNATMLVIDEQLETSSVSGIPPNITFAPVTFSGASMDIFSTIPAERIEEIFTKGQSVAAAMGWQMP